MEKDKVKEKLPKNKKEPFLSTALRGTFGWVCAFLFVAGWMFVLGVFVGRGTAPVHFDMNTLENDLAVLKETDVKKEKKEIESASGALEQKDVLDFHEALKGTRHKIEKIKPIKEPSTKSEPTKPEPTILKKKSKKADTESSNKTIAPKTITADQNKNVNNITVQVAATENLSTADQFVEKLIKKGYPAYRTVKNVSGKKIWYRVRVGHYTKKSDAKIVLNRLKFEEKTDAFLVKEQE